MDEFDTPIGGCEHGRGNKPGTCPECWPPERKLPDWVVREREGKTPSSEPQAWDLGVNWTTMTTKEELLGEELDTD